MKKKSKKARLKRKKEFRFHVVEVITRKGRKKNVRHPAYVFLEKGNLYIYVIVTHQKRVRDYMVIKLEKNPNPEDTTNAYVVMDVQKDLKSSFSERYSKWSITDKDDQLIRKFFDSVEDDQKEKDDPPSTSNDESSR